MQQQQIQDRHTSFGILGKAEVLCNTWRRLQSKSMSLLQSMTNIVAQRAATLDQPSTLEQHGVHMSRLVYKQQESLESLIRDLRSVLELFDKVKRDWAQLDQEAARHVIKCTTRPLLLQTKPAPLSTHSLIQVTAVTPAQVQDMISQLAYMHNEEFNYKAMLLSTLPSNMSNHDQIQQLVDRWDAETHIDTSLQEQVAERIKLYKTVKKVLESVD
ncbi:hypothetical protein HMPREF1544_01579 [Mucor circinelloides 1006PhL]|uniref:Uncharacterized protein n=1 Tax=Mucor circinelloides f. circinelloides (strain 1006PhL) TaxID=1220926 RepID=S2JT40_MUCC1|nr:hypothetical protein HMPREF1544_01579 [Mucor circinelloides 1006PhL]